MPYRFSTIAVMALGCLLYAGIRYHLFGGVSWWQFPAFIVNKAVSLAAVFFLLAYAVSKVRHRVEDRDRWGRLSCDFILVHLLLSYPLFQEHYYPKLFEPGQGLNGNGGFFLLCGVLAAVWVFTIRNGHLGKQWKILAGLLLVASHTCFLGGAGWFHPEKWHGGMPPISLLGFLLSLAALILVFRSGGRAANENSP